LRPFIASSEVFPPLFRNIIDPRDSRKITYTLPCLATVGMLMFLFRLGTRKQIVKKLRNGYCIHQLQAIFEVTTAPHGDTLNNLFSNIDPNEVQAVVSGMTETLIRKKVLYLSRLFEKYYVVAVDGTGTVTYGERHCPHCLTRTTNGKTIYFHNVLEAKLVTPDGFVFSLMTEFIENSGEETTKQDCELKAFYRLAANLKQRFPRLPILLSLDGLFAGGPTFELCEKNRWKFMIVLTDKDLPSVNEEFESLSALQPEHRISRCTGKKAEIRQNFRWVDSISYVDTKRREHIVTVLECLDCRPYKRTKQTTRKFKWITNCKVAAKNVDTLANDGGRIRWKIENEGFNIQKNGGYGLEHAFSNDPKAAKVFYFLLQIAHMLSQLIERGSLLKRIFPNGHPVGKDLAFRMLEAWRNSCLTRAKYQTILEGHYQIRLDSS